MTASVQPGSLPVPRAFNHSHQPVAVKLDLVQPIVALGCAIDRAGQLRCEGRQRLGLGLRVRGRLDRRCQDAALDLLDASPGGDAARQLIDDIGPIVRSRELIARLDELIAAFPDYPLLIGASRKSFIGRILADDSGTPAPASERLHCTMATITAAVLKGAHIVRVHDVKAAAETIRVSNLLRVHP